MIDRDFIRLKAGERKVKWSRHALGKVANEAFTRCGKMTGELGDKVCYFCGGHLKHRKATIPFIVGDTVVIVKQVPAEVCEQCGEPVMSGDVAANVEQLLQQAQASGVELSIG